ncbi:WXG100 family type VII secretion target [Nocardia sp. NBC_01327]|uniref:WXG100 family type VII secretion target n=1 Tax=Nocardia sp. NBC_01327 TaxID=2903593 RepID=UPI002E156D55|nr:WXG100 family type VII secretion target [Nocardia sp. NBC_01327]
MKYNFDEVDQHTGSLLQIIQGMEDNYNRIVSLKTDLLNSFQGAGAQGYTEIMAVLDGKMNPYHDSLTASRTAIVNAAALMNTTDHAAGVNFHHIA